MVQICETVRCEKLVHMHVMHVFNSQAWDLVIMHMTVGRYNRD